MGHMCHRWSSKPCEEEGHAGLEAGKTRERERGEEQSGESRQHELAQQGAVGGREEQDRHCTHTVQDSHQRTNRRERDVYCHRKIGCGQSVLSICYNIRLTV